jgi:hypothetical protein
MKKIIFTLFLFLTIFTLQSPTHIKAADCTKKTGIVVKCTDKSQPEQCVVASDFYCCTTQAACTAQQNQGNGATCSTSEGGDNEPCCGGQGGSCSTSDLTCHYGQGPSGGSLGYYCYTQSQIQASGVNGPGSSSVKCTPTGGAADTGIQTAIGCIPVLSSSNDFLAFILRWAVGIGGGIAFLLMLYAGFEIMTAAGNPERLKAGQELLTSAISGLILLIFSVFILKFIGVDILGLCNFGFNVGSCPK